MKFIGEILESKGFISKEQLESALAAQDSRDDLIGKILIRLGYIEEAQLLKALAEQFDLEYIDSIPGSVDIELLKEIAPLPFLKKNNILPYSFEENALSVATSNPLETQALDDIRSATDKVVLVALCPEKEIQASIHSIMEESFRSAEETIDDISDSDLGSLSIDLEETADLLDHSEDAPIINLVNRIFYQALKERASDIHVEPYESTMTVRFRIDGKLYAKLSPKKSYHPAIVSRIKVMAGLNIAEKRMPQDGRIRLKAGGKDVDIRVSVLPTSFGERLVLRILDRASVRFGIVDLGMSEGHKKTFNRVITSPNGIVLVTGPTGSGKTTTLYAALETLNTADRNILTVEDPVEYQLHGIGQIPVNNKVGLTFARGLRSILRQDPDIIMVGEIRDMETAEIAIQSSLTGHLVFSTLHTNDSASAVTRLADMGIEPFLVSATLKAVIAQRLVRRICENCKTEFIPENELLEELGISGRKETFFKGTGCDQCSGTGYLGRTAIYEILTISEAIRRLIVESEDSGKIIAMAIEGGMKTMREDGIDKILQGITTPEEIIAATREVD